MDPPHLHILTMWIHHISTFWQVCPFCWWENFSKITLQTYKKLINYAISINMMILVDMSYCSTNTKRRRMDLSARQKNTSCNDDMIKPASKKSTKYQMSYGQIRYLMKRLSTALDSKLKQGRPPKYCRMCHRELRKVIGSQLERRPLENKYMKGRNITEQRCDKRKNFSSAKESSKTRKCSPLSSVAAKEVHANNKTE